MLSSALSVLCSLLLYFMLVARSSTMSFSSMTAVQLFPVLPAIVSAASSPVVASIIPSPDQALATIIIGYVL